MVAGRGGVAIGVVGVGMIGVVAVVGAIGVVVVVLKFKYKHVALNCAILISYNIVVLFAIIIHLNARPSHPTDKALRTPQQRRHQ